MNLRDLGVAIAIGAVMLGIFVAAMALFGGCQPLPLPPEPPFTETVSISAAARDR